MAGPWPVVNTAMSDTAARIPEDIKTAMRAKDALALNALRALKSALMNAAIEKGSATTVLEESEVLAVIRKQSLIINLPGQPKAISETLEGLRDDAGQVLTPGIFAAVPYCIDLIDGPYIETDASICAAFRPKSAIRSGMSD